MEMLRTFLLLFVIFSMGNTGKACPRGWAKFGLRCYKFFPQRVNWFTAQRKCQNVGANLASVHSRAENNFLLGLLPSLSTNTWIGGNDVAKEGCWLWTDRTAFNFASWCSREPNNQRVENCLMISWTRNNCWNDATCSSAMASICVMG
ncbi:type-2 ice-structuring protein-like [Pseudorasbora parva]|uniref:type-2 ice-structuring protein-like n=1 Tax=Pseudorasbora parva TaxID=51549 RepID=UPI00351E2090